MRFDAASFSPPRKGIALMPENHTRRGFTWIEMVVILVILAFLLGLIVPAILINREHSRREKCMDNLKQIGLGLHNYHDARKYFPGSAQFVKTRGKAGGWSFLFMLVPLGDYDYSPAIIDPVFLKGTITNPVTVDPLTHKDPGIQYNRNQPQWLDCICPSNPNKTYEDPIKKQVASTNYKAMGATCMESLLLCENPDSPPPYGDKSNHPDGALYPTNSGIRLSDITDGTSNTIMVVETIDDSKSCWLAGADTTLVGMPKAESYQQFKKFGGNGFWAPLDYSGSYYEEAAPGIRAARTYLAFDFRPGYTDAGAYPAGVGRTPDYGPSSNHPNIVNHLFCDGAVRSIRKDMDYAAYFFLITRNNGDPGTGSPPFE
jgi:competence protein ComGC